MSNYDVYRVTAAGVFIQNWIWLIYTTNYIENNVVFVVNFILSPSVTYFRTGF